jgi:hypothetical protein
MPDEFTNKEIKGEVKNITEGDNIYTRPSRIIKANFCSRMMFSWTYPVIESSAAKAHVDLDELGGIRPSDRVEVRFS